MKTVFKILPSTDEADLNLLVVVGSQGLSLIYHKENPTYINGLMVFQYEQSGLASFAQDLEILLDSEALPPFKTSRVCYDFKETTLVPNAFYDEKNNVKLLGLLFGTNHSTNTFVQEVQHLSARLLYRIPHQISAILKKTFPLAENEHTTALQLSFLKKAPDNLYAIIYQRHIKLFLFKNDQLQLQQTFDYSTPVDVAYHVLNVCEQHQVAPSTILLQLAGFIDQDSALYQELYKYFVHISFDNQYGDVSITTELEQHPAHYFNHYFQLITCGS